MVRKITKGQVLWMKKTWRVRKTIQRVRNFVAFRTCDCILYVLATADKHEEFYKMVRLGAEEMRRRQRSETPQVVDRLEKH